MTSKRFSHGREASGSVPNALVKQSMTLVAERSRVARPGGLGEGFPQINNRRPRTGDTAFSEYLIVFRPTKLGNRATDR